jgi:dTDP-4-dehydrorhamnose 3,5-epimerase
MSLRGAFLIESEPITDERGYFARTFCAREFEAHGLDTRMVQCDISSNRIRGTIRGLHYQSPPHSETKLVRCVRGAIYDVIVDLRPASPTFLKWISVELNARELRSLYIPAGFAHGFQTLDNSTDVLYQMSQYHVPQAARGIRWSDPAIAVDWPMVPTMISARDRLYPLLNHRDAGKEFRG